jgi:hypothetical protein
MNALFALIDSGAADIYLIAAMLIIFIICCVGRGK